MATIASSRGSSMAIKVLKPGLATTVQDLGRPGYYHIGIPLSGGMDRHALAAANLLVGNEEGAAVTEAAGVGFFGDTWKVAPEADRIGYRFKGGKPLDFVPREPPFGAGSDPSNITDACYPYGSIQVPGGTEPIVLHRDAVSGGGYFMVGTVISADMDLIGQLQPNTPVKFVKVEMDQALAARKMRAELLAKVRSSLT